MSIIVEHSKTGRKFIVVAAGLGRQADRVQPRGHRFAADSNQDSQLVVVSDHDGNICWIRANELRVVSIDGHAPNSLLNELVDPTADTLADLEFDAVVIN